MRFIILSAVQHLTNCAIFWSIVQCTCNRVRVMIGIRVRVELGLHNWTYAQRFWSNAQCEH